ncbi:MAG: alkaline phosphatase family protein [Ilumatobacteraceae bacterium]
MQVHGPERLAGQGLDPEQEDSGNRAIHALLGDEGVGAQVDLVLTWRAGDGGVDGAYEVWSSRGLVRFRRLIDDRGALHFEVVEVVGDNPLGNQDPLALTTVAAEREAAAAGGFDADDAARRFIAPEQQSYPFGYERVAQLFDSPNAPDLAVSPRDWCSGSSPGTHGALHVRQARAPLWFSGPSVVVGRHEMAARSIDIAPTCLAALQFPFVDGADATGRTSSERGVEPDVRLARQDGRVLHELLDPSGPAPTRVYVLLMDGMHQTELEDRLARDPAAVPNLRRLHARAAVLAGGSIVNFPSITWPSHTSIGTGTWGGHHDVVNPTYYVREVRQTVSPQGLSMGTETYANAGVESLYEAFHRVHPDCLTAAIHAPFGRSAKHAFLEGRNLCDRARVKALTAELAVDMNPRWPGEHAAVASESLLDTRGMAQVVELFTRSDLPAARFVYHELAVTDGAGHEYGPHSEGLRDALDETDRRIGRVLSLLDERGLFDETLFVVSADHGMAPQDVDLRANPAAHVLDVGLAAVVAEPMIWLLDAAVVAERASDGRTGRVIVAENDADHTGDRPPLEGAEVIVEAHAEGHARRVIAQGTTDRNGRFGFATPSDIASEHIAISVRAAGRNSRHLLLDGTRLSFDVRSALYGPVA